MFTNFKRYLGVALLFPCLVLGAANAAAQNFPSKPVKILVPYPAGGPFDSFARGLAESLGRLWGQQVIIENRAGANEIIAAQALVTSPPDGYTLLLGADGAFSNNQFLFSKLPYDPVKDIVPVTQVVNVNMVLITRGDLPVTNVQEFVALMKKEGSKRSYGSAGAGNPTHLAFEDFKRRAGFDITHVPYKGIAPAAQDMMGGSIDAMFAGSSTAIPHSKSGRMKILAISGSKRAAALPHVPTFTEVGYNDFEAQFYMGLGAPNGTPKAVIQKIASDVRQVVSVKEFGDKYAEAFGFETVGSSPESFQGFLEKDRRLAGKRIREANVRLD
jgi:tripartite-type tricarboxylate transporter receptor subunit TctC